MRKISQAGRALLEEFEGRKLKAYKDSGGVWTIGVGHTGGVRRGQVITDEQADAFLDDDLEEAELAVDDAVTVELNDNQFAACVSLAFNVGGNAFSSSTLVRRLNAGKFAEAADQFLRWNRDNGRVVDGLTRRRKAERELFLTPTEEAIDEPDTELTTVAKSTVVTKTTEVETPTDGSTTTLKETIATVTGSEQVKEVAKTGMSAVGTRLASGGLSSGGGATVWGVITGNWKMILVGLVVLVVGAGIWALVYHQRKQIQILTARINSDPRVNDIKFVKEG